MDFVRTRNGKIIVSVIVTAVFFLLYAFGWQQHAEGFLVNGGENVIYSDSGETCIPNEVITCTPFTVTRYGTLVTVAEWGGRNVYRDSCAVVSWSNGYEACQSPEETFSSGLDFVDSEAWWVLISGVFYFVIGTLFVYVVLEKGTDYLDNRP